MSEDSRHYRTCEEGFCWCRGDRERRDADVEAWRQQALLAEKYLGVSEKRVAELEAELDHSNSAINLAHFLVDEASYTDDGQAMYVDPMRVVELREALAALAGQSTPLRKINCGCEEPCTAPAKPSPFCKHGINHAGERHGCDGCCKE